MPRINTGRILGLNANELKMVEKVHDDGSVTRYFFYPETGVGKRKPIIKTYDKGILHQEWIGKTSTADKIYIKQVGKDKPYIVVKKGNYTQVDGIQYYDDGINHIKRYGHKEPNSPEGKVQVFDKNASERRKQFPSIANTIPDYPTIPIQHGEPVHGMYQQEITDNQIKAKELLTELNLDAKKNFINLEDLLNNYKA